MTRRVLSFFLAFALLFSALPLGAAFAGDKEEGLHTLDADPVEATLTVNYPGLKNVQVQFAKNGYEADSWWSIYPIQKDDAITLGLSDIVFPNGKRFVDDFRTGGDFDIRILCGYQIYTTSLTWDGENNIELSVPYYNLTVPEGLSNVTVGIYTDYNTEVDSYRDLSAGDTFTLINGANEKDGYFRYTYEGKNFSNDFTLDGKGFMLITFPGIEGVVTDYNNEKPANWQAAGTFNNSALISYLSFVDGDYDFRVTKLSMGHTFPKFTVDTSKIQIQKAPVDTITFTGFPETSAKVSLWRSGVIYNDVATSGEDIVFNVFDVGDAGNSYYYKLSKNNHNGVITRPADVRDPATRIKAGDTINVSEFFFELRIPEGFSNIIIQQSSWPYNPVDTANGEKAWLLMNGSTGWATFTYEGETKTRVPFDFDGTQILELQKFLIVNFAGFQDVDVALSTDNSVWTAAAAGANDLARIWLNSIEIDGKNLGSDLLEEIPPAFWVRMLWNGFTFDKEYRWFPDYWQTMVIDDLETYTLTVPEGLSDVSVKVGEHVSYSGLEAGDLIVLVKNPSITATFTYTFKGVEFSNEFALDGKGFMLITFPGIEGVVTDYNNAKPANWQVAGTFDHSALISYSDFIDGDYDFRVTKLSMGHSFPKFTVATDEIQILQAPVKTITFTGFPTSAKVSLWRSGVIYNDVSTSGEDVIFNVFDVGDAGNSYYYKLSKNNHSAIITRPTDVRDPATRIYAGDTINVGAFFFELRIPEGFSNIIIQQSSWPYNPVDTANGEKAWLLMNGATGWVTFTYEGETKIKVPFAFDGTQILELQKFLVVNFAGFQDVDVALSTDNSIWTTAAAGANDSARIWLNSIEIDGKNLGSELLEETPPTFWVRIQWNGFTFVKEYTWLPDNLQTMIIDDLETYTLTVPEGLSNVSVKVGDHVSYSGLEAGDSIVLVKNPSVTATFTYTYDEVEFSNEFALNGKGFMLITFPDMENVAVKYYKYGGTGSWDNVGTFTNSGLISYGVAYDAGQANTIVTGNRDSIQVNKNSDGSTQNFYYVDIDENAIQLLPVATKKIIVDNILTDCQIGLVQSNWVYPMQDFAAGDIAEFNVFDNGRDYFVRFGKIGHYAFDVTVAAGGTIDARNHFYNIEVPEGFSDVRINQANWICYDVGEGYVISFLKNYQEATIRYFYNGVETVKTFLLDGSDPFVIPDPELEPVYLDVFFTGLTGAHIQVRVEGEGNWITLGIADQYAYGLELDRDDFVFESGKKLSEIFRNGGAFTLRVGRDSLLWETEVLWDGISERINIDVPTYSLTLPDGVSNVSVDLVQNVYSNLNAGESFTLIKDAINKDAKITYTSVGVEFNNNFVLDGSGFMLITFPGIEAVDAEYSNTTPDDWTIVGPFSNSALVSYASFTDGLYSFQVRRKPGMLYNSFPKQDVDTGKIQLLNTPVGTITFNGFPTTARISLWRNNVIYDYVDVIAGQTVIFNVFDVGTAGNSYYFKLTKENHSAPLIQYPTNPTRPTTVDGEDRIAVNSIIDVSKYFYFIEIPEYFKNVVVKQHRNIYNPVDVTGGEKAWILKNGAIGWLTFTYGDVTVNEMEYYFDGSQPFKTLDFELLDNFMHNVGYITKIAQNRAANLPINVSTEFPANSNFEVFLLNENQEIVTKTTFSNGDAGGALKEIWFIDQATLTGLPVGKYTVLTVCNNVYYGAVTVNMINPADALNMEELFDPYGIYRFCFPRQGALINLENIKVTVKFNGVKIANPDFSVIATYPDAAIEPYVAFNDVAVTSAQGTYYILIENVRYPDLYPAFKFSFESEITI